MVFIAPPLPSSLLLIVNSSPLLKKIANLAYSTEGRTCITTLVSIHRLNFERPIIQYRFITALMRHGRQIKAEKIPTCSDERQAYPNANLSGMPEYIACPVSKKEVCRSIRLSCFQSKLGRYSQVHGLSSQKSGWYVQVHDLSSY